MNLQSGGTITVNQRTFIGALDQNGGTVSGSGELVATLTATNSGSLNAVIADGPDFAAGILKRTSSTTTIGAANTFTGTINLQGGTLQLGAGGSFNSASSLVTSSGATMDLNNKSQTFSRISGAGGTVSLGTGNLTINQSSESEFGGSITGSGGLTKTGSGHLTLTGTSIYLGATTVSGGNLKVNGSLASTATVQDGARRCKHQRQWQGGGIDPQRGLHRQSRQLSWHPSLSMATPYGTLGATTIGNRWPPILMRATKQPKAAAGTSWTSAARSPLEGSRSVTSST